MLVKVAPVFVARSGIGGIGFRLNMAYCDEYSF